MRKVMRHGEGLRCLLYAGLSKRINSSLSNSRRFFCGCFIIIMIVMQIVICEDANAGVNDMKKTDFAQKILADVGSLTNTPVNDFNKKVLSDLANPMIDGNGCQRELHLR